MSSYYNDVFTSDVWNKLKSLFNFKYLYREIGFETPEMWRHYIELEFIENIESYIARLTAYKNLSSDIYNNAETNIEEETDFEDLPMTPLDTSTHLSTRTGRKSKGTARNNITEIEIFDKYSKLIRDLDEEFVEYFNKCFMLIY